MKTASVHSLQLTKNMRYFVPENGQSGPMEKLTKLQDGPGILWPSPSRRSPSSHQQARSPHASVSQYTLVPNFSINFQFETVDPRNHLTRCEPGKVAEIPGINSNISSVVWKYFQLNSTKYYHITKSQWNQSVKILKHSFDSYNRRTVLPGWQVDNIAQGWTPPMLCAGEPPELTGASSEADQGASGESSEKIRKHGIIQYNTITHDITALQMKGFKTIIRFEARTSSFLITCDLIFNVNTQRLLNMNQRCCFPRVFFFCHDTYFPCGEVLPNESPMTGKVKLRAKKGNAAAWTLDGLWTCWSWSHYFIKVLMC